MQRTTRRRTLLSKSFSSSCPPSAPGCRPGGGPGGGSRRPLLLDQERDPERALEQGPGLTRGREQASGLTRGLQWGPVWVEGLGKEFLFGGAKLLLELDLEALWKWSGYPSGREADF
ncbi:hypothetical protein EYF80_024759 [Liparis tanakae]|uniref:Uncharacterized protein n=1 Tax=Liparis tanakae TaxID=230148 RepID=A0A4Z2HHK7_9TELE|nr:hypothetical protein EYF80_024759 [Liparis tanakae]